MEMGKKCTGCGRGCDLSAPHCPRGEEYARTGVMPERRAHEGKNGHERHGQEDHRHGRRHGRPPVSAEEYAALPTEEKLLHMLRHLGFLSRHGFDGKEGQTRILRILHAQGTMTQRELTEKLGIQPGSASETIGKVERAGLITRAESERDRRTVDISLTEEGRKRAIQAADERPTDLFRALSEEERATLLPLLEKLSADWEKQKEDRNVEIH